MMTRWIENVSKDDVKNGHHYDAGPNAMLIRIQDPATEFGPVKHQFTETYCSELLAAEDTDGFPDECKISDSQANELVMLLSHAMENSMNVLVHCHAGICRSGAVTEVATMMGFTATDRFRQPNLRVKHKMMKVLGLTYDSDEKPSSTGGYLSLNGLWLPDGFEGDV